MLKEKCTECGALRALNSTGDCNSCGDFSYWVICEVHQENGMPPVFQCSECQRAIKLNNERSENTDSQLGGESVVDIGGPGKAKGGSHHGVEFYDEHRSKELRSVLELCLIYMVSIDGEMTAEEQLWVDKQFGEDVTNRIMHQCIKGIDWGAYYTSLQGQLLMLSRTDKLYMLNCAKPLLLELLSQDELGAVEMDHLETFMEYVSNTIESV